MERIASYYLVGLDVGSTTVKATAVDPISRDVVFSTYRRHHAHQVDTAISIFDDICPHALPADARLRIAVTGSGGTQIAHALGVPFVQEVIANSVAVQEFFPQVRCAIELGGQDAKMVFFEPGAARGTLKVADMRMNGSCAGGTGAFLDEIASLLKLPTDQLDGYASRGVARYSISGRCGVFAKTDIQPLINQGAAKEDIVRSVFHAMAKQTIGGLAQGLEIIPPVIFEGGPLTFNPSLVDVFAERLRITSDDVVVPESPETFVSLGAALALERLFPEFDGTMTASQASRLLADESAFPSARTDASRPFFETAEELSRFRSEHETAPQPPGCAGYAPGSSLPVYLGIDSGSTTTKFALIDAQGELVDSFYANNGGDPLGVACAAFAELQERYREAGVVFEVLGVATTGYGEMMFARAFHADCHVVETVAHALAAARYVDDATFILDIGGQDMKAIWIDHGIVTDILVNEACSSGCGSFLENFAKSLGIATDQIADAAFRSKNPAQLGSRCTVFMTSSVVTEQRNGKSPDDIMAGLCRSIIQNVFAKVIRISNLDKLGERIVVQGGTFVNDAVLAAFEEHVGRAVTRAPYPGLMGAIGAALYAMRHRGQDASDASSHPPSSFIGLEAAACLGYTQESNSICPFCANACSRTVITFSDGSTWVTGNRCERGEVVGDPKDEHVREAVRAIRARRTRIPNLFEVREKLLLDEYPALSPAGKRNITIGLPRVLAFWDTMPFWSTFFRSLGFNVQLSHASTRVMYEEGLPAVTSDTVCFPAKLVHGHIRDLERMGVDYVFMPSITTVPSENTAKTSESMCAVVKGYAIVLSNSDNPGKRSNTRLVAPLFHWYSDADRNRQLCEHMERTFGIDRSLTQRAIAFADEAQRSFRGKLLAEGKRALGAVRDSGSFAVVLASRPYHNDTLVNHDIPSLFVEQGIAVFTPDALSGVTEVDLSQSRLDIVNNYHARMIASALLAARDPNLEYVQLVSFGCGHDAYLSDEIVRLTHEVCDKSPLILKVDESDVTGPLHIRIRSFIETVAIKRADFLARPLKELADPYPVKFRKTDRRRRVVLIPNTSHAFSELMAAVFYKQGLLEVHPMEIGREEAIRLGKRYVHNDICFPAQIVIGEALAELESGRYDGCEVAVATGKYIGDCRLTHYGALLRKALDDAGYAHVPIITNDDADFHNLHPGFKMSVASAARIAMGLPMIDALEGLLRKMRPYELVPGSADAAFDRAIRCVMDGMRAHGARGAQRGFFRAIRIMRFVAYDRSKPRPRVLIVGEYLLNFHPGANHDVERYLEDNGFEVIEARMTDVIRKTYFYKGAQIAEYGISKPVTEEMWYTIANALFEHAHNVCDRIAGAHPLYEPACRMPELVKGSDEIIHHTFDAGEGVLIPGEIIHHANRGVRSFLILQPFGCLPNHIVGRGIVKRLKELYPDAQILPLDYDPDVSFANIENRLQMLIMNANGSAVAEPPECSVEAITRAVETIASEERELLEQAISNSEHAVGEGGAIDDPEQLKRAIGVMREGLAREDQFAARAKEALSAARRAAVEGAAGASENLARGALTAYEIACSMRTRTLANLAAVQDVLKNVEAGGTGVLEGARRALSARVEDSRTFARGLLEEARKLLEKR